MCNNKSFLFFSCLLFLLCSFFFGCASEMKFLPEKGLTDEQIIDAFYNSQPVREHYRKLIVTHYECSKELYDATIEEIKYLNKNLYPYLEDCDWEGVKNLSICIAILEEVRNSFPARRNSQIIEYAKVLQLLLRCYFDNYYKGEGDFRCDTQDNIITVLEEWFKIYEQNKSDLKWRQLGSEIDEMVSNWLAGEVAGNSMEESMPKVFKWWIEHQRKQN